MNTKELSDYCNKQNQKVFRDVLKREYNITTYGHLTPRKLLPYCSHDIYDNMVAEDKILLIFEHNGISNFIISDFVIKAYAKFLGVTLDTLVNSRIFKLIVIGHHYLSNTNETKYNTILYIHHYYDDHSGDNDDLDFDSKIFRKHENRIGTDNIRESLNVSILTQLPSETVKIDFPNEQIHQVNNYLIDGIVISENELAQLKNELGI